MFVHLSIHAVKPEMETQLADSMSRFSAAMKKCSGWLSAYVLKDEDSGKLVGLALWETREQWEQSLPKMRDAVKDDPFDQWEFSMPEVYHLNPIR